MPRFNFKAYDASGRLVRGDIEADGREAALDALTRSGRFPVDVGLAGDTHRSAGEAEPKWWNRELLGSRAMPVAALAVLARELATLVNADLPIDEVLRVIALQPRLGSRARRLIRAVLERVTAGASLSDALAAQDGAIPLHFSRLVQAGEASGTLPQVLDELAGFLEQSDRLRSQIVTAMLYPSVLLLAAVTTVAVIVAVMVPAIMPLFRDAGIAPPLLVVALEAIERGVLGNWPIALAASAGLLVAPMWIGRNDGARVLRDRAILRLPVLGELERRACTARFARTLATLTRNGVPMLEALNVSAGVLRNRAFEAAVRNAATEVNQGGVLLAPLTRSGLFPDLALRLIAVGEQSGQLATMLTRVAEIYEYELQQQVQRILAVAAPAITLLIGGFVGVLILSVMSALLGLNEAVLR